MISMEKDSFGKSSHRKIKISRISLVDQVCASIKKDIVDGIWKVGDKLPSESDFADAFGVNRLTVRMALQKLNTLGIVETKAGDGTFVKEFDFSQYVSEVSSLILHPDMLDGVLEFRKVIEIECLHLAVLRASDEDIANLDQAVENYGNMFLKYPEIDEAHVDEFVSSDLEFHYQICVASNNKVYPLAYTAVKELIFQYLKIIFMKRLEKHKSSGVSVEQYYKEGVRAHRTIVEAIRNRDFETCRKKYLELIDYNYPGDMLDAHTIKYVSKLGSEDKKA